MKIHEQATSILTIDAVGIFPSIHASDFFELKKIPESSKQHAEIALQNAHAIAQKLFKRSNSLTDEEQGFFKAGLYGLALVLVIGHIGINDSSEQKQNEIKKQNQATARRLFTMIGGFQSKKFDNFIRNQCLQKFIAAKAL